MQSDGIRYMFVVFSSRGKFGLIILFVTCKCGTHNSTKKMQVDWHLVHKLSLTFIIFIKRSHERRRGKSSREKLTLPTRLHPSSEPFHLRKLRWYHLVPFGWGSILGPEDLCHASPWKIYTTSRQRSTRWTTALLLGATQAWHGRLFSPAREVGNLAGAMDIS